MEITQGIHRLKIPYTIQKKEKESKRYVNVYIIYGQEIHLIDSGVAGSEKQIFEEIRSEGRDPQEISLLLLTHSHPDHIGAAKAIKEQTKCLIACHPTERDWIRETEKQIQKRPVPGIEKQVSCSVDVDFVIEDKDLLDVNGMQLEILHTPGHSRGSVCFFLEDQGVLFSGDAVIVPDRPPVYEDPLASRDSLLKLQDIEEIEWLLSSWDEPKKGKNAYESIQDGLDYLEKVHKTVKEIEENKMTPEACKKVLKKLGLRSDAYNPMVQNTLQEHKKLLKEPIDLF